MRAGLLLDTHALYWIANGEPIADPATAAVKEVRKAGLPILVSPFSAWEIGMLAARGRISLAIAPGDWFARVLANGGVELAPMDPDILIASSFLPGEPPRDPADRIIAATARQGGHRLVTRDRLLLSYAEAGHLRAIAC